MSIIWPHWRNRQLSTMTVQQKQEHWMENFTRYTGRCIRPTDTQTLTYPSFTVLTVMVKGQQKFRDSMLSRCLEQVAFQTESRQKNIAQSFPVLCLVQVKDGCDELAPLMQFFFEQSLPTAIGHLPNCYQWLQWNNQHLCPKTSSGDLCRRADRKNISSINV